MRLRIGKGNVLYGELVCGQFAFGGQVMRAAFRVFESYEESWEELFRRAAHFATELGRERVIGISQSESVRSKGTVVVWYWESAERSPV